MTDTPDNADILAPAANPDLRWYVVHAYSGMEKAVERNIAERIARSGIDRKSTRLNSSHIPLSRMPSSA